MKKLFLAACLVAAIGPAFSQSINNTSANNHGEGDCQCIGIGIPVYVDGKDVALTPSTPSNSSTTQQPNGGQQKELVASPGLWYTYFELYLMEIRNNIHAKKVH